MDPYVGSFMENGGSFITLAKKQIAPSHKGMRKTQGFYRKEHRGTCCDIGAELHRNISVIEFEELGMEAIFKIEVEDFPAFIVVDDKNNDFYSTWLS